MTIGTTSELSAQLVLEILVYDLGRSLEFYKELGFELERRTEKFAVVRWDDHLFIKDRAGNGTAVLPADRLLWTQQCRDLADAMKVASGPEAKLVIWTTGVFSKAARTGLTDRGISLFVAKLVGRRGRVDRSSFNKGPPR